MSAAERRMIMRDYYMSETPITDAMAVTNADRIRAMSDEELAKFIGEEGFHCEICSKGVNSECDLRCSTYCLEWLQQPAEE